MLSIYVRSLLARRFKSSRPDQIPLVIQLVRKTSIENQGNQGVSQLDFEKTSITKGLKIDEPKEFNKKVFTRYMQTTSQRGNLLMYPEVGLDLRCI